MQVLRISRRKFYKTIKTCSSFVGHLGTRPMTVQNSLEETRGKISTLTLSLYSKFLDKTLHLIKFLAYSSREQIDISLQNLEGFRVSKVSHLFLLCSNTRDSNTPHKIIRDINLPDFDIIDAYTHAKQKSTIIPALNESDTSKERKKLHKRYDLRFAKPYSLKEAENPIEFLR